MLDCTRDKGVWIVNEVTDEGCDISLDIAEAKTPELAWMKAANFLNEKLNKLRNIIDEGMWDKF